MEGIFVPFNPIKPPLLSKLSPFKFVCLPSLIKTFPVMKTSALNCNAWSAIYVLKVVSEDWSFWYILNTASDWFRSL